jgi:hypothetical protein
MANVNCQIDKFGANRPGRTVRMASTTLSYEFLLRHFRARRGLYILGAGASAGASESAGEVPFGHDFLIGPALEYVRGGSFPVTLPIPSELSGRIKNAARGVSLSRVFPDRILRPGAAEEFPYQELLQRMPDGFARLYMKHDLSKVRFAQRPRENYTVFRYFYPAMLINYNLDGLATEYCGDVHQVVTPHGTIPREFGSPDAAKLLARVREYDVRLGLDGLVLCVPESCGDSYLENCLLRMAICSPSFIAIIGYTFGRNGNGHDDWISLDKFKRAFRRFAGNIYIVEPRPEHLREMIEDSIESNNVFGVPAYWNILAHSFAEAARNRIGRRSLTYVCGQILDRHGNRVVFPLTLD